MADEGNRHSEEDIEVKTHKVDKEYFEDIGIDNTRTPGNFESEQCLTNEISTLKDLIGVKFVFGGVVEDVLVNAAAKSIERESNSTSISLTPIQSAIWGVLSLKCSISFDAKVEESVQNDFLALSSTGSGKTLVSITYFVLFHYFS
jgi:superfamily II DNA/RNA helicase